MSARTRMFVKGSVVLLVLVAAGCSSLRLGGQAAPPTNPQTAATEPAPTTAEPQAIRVAPPSQATVAAIEEFLERTRDYSGSVAAPDQTSAQPVAHATPTDHVPVDPALHPQTVTQRPNVDVTRVTAAQSAAMTPPAYDWTARYVANTEPLATSTSPAGEQDRVAPAASAVPQRQPQPTDRLVSERTPPQTAAPVETKPRMPTLPVLQSVSIGVPTPSNEVSVAETGMSNVPVEVLAQPARPTWRNLIEELSDQAETSGDVAAFWRLGFAHLASDQIGQPTPDMSRLSVEARTLLESFLQTAASIRDQIVDPISGGAQTLQHVEALRRAVAAAADPVVSAVALCRRVTTFGVYEEMGPADIVAGRTAQTIVYCELDNLRAKELDDGRFETNLATRVEVLTSDGRSTWTHEEPQIIDQCRRHRRDFFLAQRLTMPATLPAGEYVLKVMVEDLNTGRTSEAIKPFVISSALSLAERGRDVMP